MIDEQYAFDRVVAPVPVEQFLAEYFERKPLLVHREQPDYYDGVVSVAAFDEFLTGSRPLLSQVYLVDARREIAPEEYTFADQRIDVVRAYQLFAEGTTIAFRQMQDHVPLLARLCRAAELVFNCPFQTNLYFTPAGAQGFKTHHDTHDVFVLQVSGSKRWRAYEPQVVLPLAGQEFVRPDAGPGPPTAEFTLRAGDLWYCPRGIPHDANSTNEPSLHITFGALARTWAEVMIEAMADLSLVDPMFRRSLPPGYITDGVPAAALERTFRELAERFSRSARLGPALEGVAEDFITTRPAFVPGQREQTLALESVTLDSLLGTRPDIVYRWRRDEGTVRLHYRNIEICFPRWVDPALRYALEHAEYRARELPGELDDAGKLVLVRRLIREGLVRRLPERGASVA
jgi:ribosomal protein L16 Arg81 hydroxylase